MGRRGPGQVGGLALQGRGDTLVCLCCFAGKEGGQLRRQGWKGGHGGHTGGGDGVERRTSVGWATGRAAGLGDWVCTCPVKTRRVRGAGGTR